MKISSELIRKCIKIDFTRLPAEVIDRAKYLFLDYLGVAARGSMSASAQSVQRTLDRLGPATDGAVIVGTPQTAGAPYAALANGVASHSIELDDVVNEASLHPAVTVMTAALAAAHLGECSGARFIEAIVAGYETVVRLGIGLDPSAHYAQGFHPTATCGTLGAAVAAARAMNLNAAETANALGIAGSQAAGSMEFLADGSLTKQFHAGWAAHSGLMAALLAREGFTGPGSIIEGKFGFLKAYSSRPKPDKILSEWGRPYQVLKTSIKPHSCCRYKQGPIDGILKIVREKKLAAADIETVTLGILKTGFPIVVDPIESKLNPVTVVDAQFSMPFGAAVAILHGKATLEEYTPEKIESADVKAMMKRIRCVEAPELEIDFPRKWPASVLIQTRQGQTFSEKIEYPKGDPENALSWDELIQKFKTLSRPLYSEQRAEDIIVTVRSLESAKTISGLSSLFAADMGTTGV